MSPSLEIPPIVPPFTLTDALNAIDQAESTAGRLRAAADAFQSMGFDRVMISLRDASMNVSMVVSAGSADPRALDEPLPGAVWRRRLTQLERFRLEELYLLEGSDPWVAREFYGTEPSPRGDGQSWLPTDLLLGMLRGADRELLGIVKLALPRDARRPDEQRRCEIASVVRHLAARVAFDALRTLAQRRADRLQRLQEAGAAMARLLDEDEIMRELARQALRATASDGVTIGVPNLDQDLLVTRLHSVRGIERVRGVVRLGEGIIAEVARTGKPVRVGDREADRDRAKAGRTPPLSKADVVGDSGPAASVLAVPLRAGIHLLGVLAVFATSGDVFSAEDEEVLATMASQAATALANARRYAESERERRQTEALADVARAVSESLRLGEVLRLILRHAISLLGVEGACIALRNDDYMHIVAAVGVADVLAGVHLPVASSLLGKAVMDNEMIVSNDFLHDPRSSRAVQRLTQVKRAVLAPLMTAHGTIGSIAVLNREAPFTEDDARVLQRLADHVAVAIVNARLFEEIERATREWKVAFDAIASGMVVLDDAMLVRRCNARAAELCDIGIPDLLGKPFGPTLLGSVTPAAAELMRLVQRSLADGVSVRDVVRDEQRARRYEFVVAPHPDGGCVVTFDDVTAEQRLAERHHRVLETVTDAIVITDPDGRISFANAAANTMFRAASLVDRFVADITAVESMPEVTWRERAAMDGAPQRYECRLLCDDGSQRVVSVSSAPLFEAGHVTGVVACLRDLEPQSARVEPLTPSAAHFEQLIESASDAIFTVDLEGCLTFVNRGFLVAVGRPQHELIGTSYVQLVDARDQVQADGMLARSAAGERDRQAFRYIGAQGALRVGTVTTSPILAHGVVVGTFGVMRDVTDEEIDREVSTQRSRLETAAELLQGVANELNNPLTSLLALTDLGAESLVLAPADREVLNQIATQALRVSSLFRQLLEATTVDPSATHRTDVTQTVRRTIELHGYGRRISGVTVTTALADALPFVAGDGHRLQQVLTNLLRNADEAVAQARAPRNIHITTRLEQDREMIDVSDSGHGIAPADIARVFDPLYTTRAQRGRKGYGLAIARQIVEEQQGVLTVRSTLGQGATFSIALPAIMHEDLPDQGRATIPERVETARAAVLQPTAASSPSAAPSRGSLLVIEDEITLRTAISRYLRRQGYEVDVAESGTEALHLLEQRSYDLALLDLRLKDMPGSDVYRVLEERIPWMADCVLFMTGDLSRPEAAHFIRATHRPVIAKPFLLAELESRVRALIAERTP